MKHLAEFVIYAIIAIFGIVMLLTALYGVRILFVGFAEGMRESKAERERAKIWRERREGLPIEGIRLATCAHCHHPVWANPLTDAYEHIGPCTLEYTRILEFERTGQSRPIKPQLQSGSVRWLTVDKILGHNEALKEES